MKRAAFFQGSAELWDRSFEDGIVQALLACGCEVDVFAPDGDRLQDLYPPGVRRLAVDYRRAWLARKAGRRSWRSYDLFAGTPDLAVAFAGILAWIARRPLVCACDEVYDSGHPSPATSGWQRAALWAMRRAALTVIPETERVELQRDRAGLSGSHRFVLYPCCFSQDYPGPDRAEARRALGLAPADTVLALAAELHSGNGADWAIELLERVPGLKLILSPAGRLEAVTAALLDQLAAAGRVVYFRERTGFRESAGRIAAADAALVVYRAGPDQRQYHRVGLASQRLCSALWAGVPVIALAQPSFRFVEEFGCGVLIRGAEDLPEAVAFARSHREEMSAAARRALHEHVRAPERLAELTAALREVLEA